MYIELNFGQPVVVIDDWLAPESKLVQKKDMSSHDDAYVRLYRHGVHASCSDLTPTTRAHHREPSLTGCGIDPLFSAIPMFLLVLAVLESHFDIPGPTFSELQNHLLKVS